MKTVIMAGGKGTRLSPAVPGIPKPMVKICGKPVLEHEIKCLREQGFREIIITVSYMASVIMDYFGDGSGISPSDGKPFGVRIEYFMEEKSLGNAGALFRLKDRLDGDFLLLNADSMFDVDFRRFVEFHKLHGGMATLFTHPNSHPYDSGLVIAGRDHLVQQWLAKEEARPRYYKNRVNAGLHVLNSRLLEKEPETEKVDLDRQILKPLAGTGELYCYDSPEYVKDMGTPERYYSVIKDYEAGIVQKRNLRNKQKAVFLDRDGTINQYAGFLSDVDSFRLLDGVCEAVRKINESGYLAVVVTNQPVIARGGLTFEGLEEIHNKMETLLGQEGAYLDAVYYCPHHPDKGFEGEVAGLKIECGCRKPKPGMLLKAAEDLNIDLASSWMVGDGERDIGAGRAAGCHTALIGKGKYGQESTVGSLLEFTDSMIRENNWI